MTHQRRVAGLAALLLWAVPAGPSAGEATVELITIGPDYAIDTRFGHVLLRVRDAADGRDDAYDFGVAPFYRPDFMVNTVLGRALFSLRRSPTQGRLASYRLADRSVESQHLNLTPAQTARLLERLEWNLRPENVDYRYDHAIDNCATRIRDLLDDVTDGAIREAADRMEVSRSYRDDILAAASGRLLALIGIELVGGVHGDDVIGAWERAYLPDYLRDAVSAAHNAAAGAALVSEVRVLYARKASPAIGGSVIAGRVVVLCVGASLGLALAVCGIAARRARRVGPAWGRLTVGLLLPAVAFSGLLGLALLPIWLFSTAHLWIENENALLFVPLDLLMLGPGVSWLRTGQPRLGWLLRGYLNVRIAVVAALAIGGLLGAFAQQNATFVAAVACVLVGLRLQPEAVKR